MEDLITVARPYAKAAFAVAQREAAADEWQQVLTAAAGAVREPLLDALLGDPRVATGQLAAMLCEVLSLETGGSLARFITLLAENRRLEALPEIQGLFAELRREHDGIAEVVVRTARDLGAAQIELIGKSLQRRLQRQVEVVVEVDDSLLGGAVLRVGDQVIDGSLTGQLAALAASLQR